MAVAYVAVLAVIGWVLVRAVHPRAYGHATPIGAAAEHPAGRLPTRESGRASTQVAFVPSRSLPEPTFRCRPLFYSRRAGQVHLDCLVSSGGDSSASGSPVSVDVGLPDTEWLAAAVAALLRDWALDQQLLDMSIAASGHRVVLSNGDSTIRLRLHATAGMSG